MNELPNGELFQALSSTWETAINEGRPRDVILGALLANLFFRERRDEPFEHAVLIYVRKAATSGIDLPATLLRIWLHRPRIYASLQWRATRRPLTQRQISDAQWNSKRD